MSSENLVSPVSQGNFTGGAYAAVPIKKRPISVSLSQEPEEIVNAKERRKNEATSNSAGNTGFHIESILSKKFVPNVSGKNAYLESIPLPDNDSTLTGSTSEDSNNSAFLHSDSQNSNAMQRNGFNFVASNDASLKDDLPVFAEESLPTLTKLALPKLRNTISKDDTKSSTLYEAKVHEMKQNNASSSQSTNIINDAEFAPESYLDNSSQDHAQTNNNMANKSIIGTYTNDIADDVVTQPDPLPNFSSSRKFHSVKVEKKPSRKNKLTRSASQIIDLTLDDDDPGPFPVPKRQFSNSQVIDLTSTSSPDSEMLQDASEVESSYLTKHLKASSMVADFVLKYINSIGGFPVNLKVLKTDLGLQIIGFKSDVEKAENILHKKQWYGEEISFCCPELRTHFQSDSWKDFKKVLDTETRCVIEILYQKDNTQDSSQKFQTQSHSQDSNSVAALQVTSQIDKDLSALDQLIEDELPLVQPKALPDHSPAPSSRLGSTIRLGDSDKEINYGEIRVIVGPGDISEECTDAIVNAVMGNFDFNASVISRTIVQKGGDQIMNECRRRNNGDFGPFVRVTGGYALKCKHVIHLVTPTTIPEYANRLLSVLHAANHMRLQSLAIPTIGAGGVNLNPALVSQCMATAFEKFAHTRPEHLKVIKVVVYDVFLQQIFISNVVTAKVMQNYGSNRVLSLEQKIKSMDTSNYAVICVKSDRTSSAAQAKERILSHMRNHVIERKVDNDIVVMLGDHDCIDIYEASIKYGVRVDYKQGSAEEQGIVLCGLSTHVNDLYDYIRELWYELREGAILAKTSIWKWEIATQVFVDLPYRVSSAIEKCFEQNNRGVADVRLFGETIKVNFSAMSYTFLSAHGRLQKGGTQSSDLSFPPEWVPMSDKTLMRVPLQPHSIEYQGVCNKFFISNPCVQKIEKIERIQNVPLYRQFLVQKSHVTKNMKSSYPVERELFHGTSEADAANICAHGFNRSFVGKNGTAFGKGCYFAVQSSYSVGFTKRGRGMRYGCIFLSMVLTGDYTQGRPDMKSPPEKSTDMDEKHLFDSVVDNINNPTMFVVFKDSSVYPSYLITFS